MIWNLLLSETEETSKASSGNSGWATYIMLGVIVLALIGMFVWQTISNKKKQKEAKEALNKIKVGDRVKTIGGICGFIAEIRDKDNTFVLETGLEGKTCFIRFDRGAIYQTAPEGEVKEEPVEVKEEIKVEEKPAEAVEAVAEETVVAEEKPAKKAKKSKKQD